MANRAFQLNAFQQSAFQAGGMIATDTVTYHQHPVNCIMAGAEPLNINRRPIQKGDFAKMSPNMLRSIFRE